jgi:hypothetical protein
MGRKPCNCGYVDCGHRSTSRVHMGVWNGEGTHYRTRCRPNVKAGNLLVVRGMEEWPKVTCKMCMESGGQKLVRADRAIIKDRAGKIVGQFTHVEIEFT